MPQVTIDGKTIEVPAGTLVVEASKPVGSHIPVYCYHPKLAPAGMCRLCLVRVGTPKIDPATKQPLLDEQGNPQIAWMPKLQTGCTTVVSEGMSVVTTSPEVLEARRSILEFLLTSHPLDCPVCDKGGECTLQDHTLHYGPGNTRFYVESKFHTDKMVPLSPLILLDRERCIQCGRCVRFQDEVAGEPVLGLQNRGRGLEVTTFDDPPFNSNFSGNTIDLCPVGALTSRDFRFTARVFELNDRPSVCQHCSVGCNLNLGARDNTIRRITPRENTAVNEIWVCDKGRYVHHYAHSADRIITPMIRADADLQPVSWYEALTFVANRIRPSIADGGKSMAGLAGDHLANEDLYLFQKLFREVLGSQNLDHRIGWAQWNAGAELVKNFGAGVGTNLGELGKGTTVLVLGADLQNEQPVLRLRLSKIARQDAKLIVANGRVTKLAQYATHTALYKYGAEAYFVLGIVRAMLDAGLHKPERAKEAEAFVAALTLSVAECAENSGVSAETLQELGKAFASSENGIVLFGREFMFAMQSDPAVQAALNALIVLSGHFGRKDNGVIALYPHNNSMGAQDMQVVPQAAGAWNAQDMLAKAKVLYVMGADPARGNPSFRNPGFLIVQDLYMTETAQKADVVFPAASWAERDGTFTNTERRVQHFTGALMAPGHARPDWQIVRDVAQELGAQWEYQSSADVMNEITQHIPTYAKMAHARLRVTVRRRASVQTVGGDAADPVQIALGELLGDVSGVQWASAAETDADAKFDVKYVAPKAAAATGGAYLAVTRALLDRGSAMQFSEIVQPRVPDAVAEINSHDAEAWNIVTGDAVKITFDLKPPRTLQVRAQVGNQTPPGVIALANNLDGTMNLPMGARVQVAKA
ncbi:MAG: NADH dehydrogenase (quinone) subunit G [Chloroflexi bacterium]|nr:MAG: NADH dehydrogenase (quinone) subunit G [Chloroflexota bacterium]